MNIRMVLRVVGRVTMLVAGSMLIPLVVALLYGVSPVPF